MIFSLILASPAVVKIATVFVLILVLYRLKIPLSISILINAVLLGMWTDGKILESLRWQLANVTAAESVMLALAIVLLLLFTESLNRSGRMTRTIDALKTVFRNPRLLYGGLPALVGLLPMPGGAIFSAPMVDALDKDKKLAAPLKTAINYWFRHVWEYWWPLYPGVILAMKYSGLPVAVYIGIQFPLTICAVLGGSLFILAHVKKANTATVKTKPGMWAALVPIAMLVGIAVGGSYLLPLLSIQGTAASLLAMLAGLVVALGTVFIRTPSSLIPSLAIFKKTTIWEFVILVIGIQAFSAALKRPLNPAEMTLVGSMRDEFLHLGIPLLAVMIAVPFVSGMVTGVAMGFVGASFPLVFALLGPNPHFNEIAGLTTLAYASGYLGMILSPVHICFVVTNEYFKSRMLDAYRYILLPSAVVAAGAIACSASYYMLFR